VVVRRQRVNARPHASGSVSEILLNYGWQVLSHPPYSPDMSPPPAFDLFPNLKKPLRGKRFRSIEELSNEVNPVIGRLNNADVLTGIQDLTQTLDRCDKAQWRSLMYYVKYIHFERENIQCAELLE